MTGFRMFGILYNGKDSRTFSGEMEAVIEGMPLFDGNTHSNRLLHGGWVIWVFGKLHGGIVILCIGERLHFTGNCLIHIVKL